jgi:hypothetical protein
LAAQKKLAAEYPDRSLHQRRPRNADRPVRDPTAYSKNLDGISIAPAVFLWNVEKSDLALPVKIRIWGRH